MGNVSTPEPPDPAQLGAYFNGQCAPRERHQIDQWMAADPEHRAWVGRMRAAWTMLGEVEHAEREQGAHRQQRARRVAIAHPSWRPAAIAAAVVVALGIGLVVGTRERTMRLAAPSHDLTTSAGQRLTATLLDGTQVTLAPESRLHVPATYGRTAREVELEGEGYFTVVHDAARPFMVHAANAVATDVGTAFDVRAYAGDSSVRVAVAEGRVAVAVDASNAPAGVQSAALAAGDVAAVWAAGTVSSAHVGDLGPYIAWTRGELVFTDVPFRDVLTAIGRWYGLQIRLADSALGSRPVRATYSTESMTDVLTLVTSAVGAHYTRAGRSVVVVGNRPSR